MKVKILISVAGIGFSYSEGEIVEMNDDNKAILEELLKFKLAIPVEEKKFDILPTRGRKKQLEKE